MYSQNFPILKGGMGRPPQGNKAFSLLLMDMWRGSEYMQRSEPTQTPGENKMYIWAGRHKSLPVFCPLSPKNQHTTELLTTGHEIPGSGYKSFLWNVTCTPWHHWFPSPSNFAFPDPWLANSYKISPDSCSLSTWKKQVLLKSLLPLQVFQKVKERLSQYVYPEYSSHLWWQNSLGYHSWTSLT